MTAISRRHCLASAAALVVSAPFVVRAQGTTPLRVILPFSPGSGVDTIFRAAQGALSKALGGQPVVVDNLPGAGGISGTQAIVKAAPDGFTVGMVSNNHTVNPSVFKKMPYDGVANLTPISVIGVSPFLLLVNPTKVPARTAREFQAFL